MIDFLNQLDTRIFLSLNGLHSDFFDSFMMLFTGRFIWIPMYVAIAALILRACRWRKALVYIIALGIAILLTDQTCATFIRPAVERLRPSNLENPLSAMTYIVDGYRGGSYGFPSCHSANSFALAVFISLMFPRRRIVLFIIGWALINSYSRIYLGVHYPGDLLVGAIVGSAYGSLVYLAAARLAPMPRDVRLSRSRLPLLPSDSTRMASAPGASRLGGEALNLPVYMAPVAVFAATIAFIIVKSL